MAQSRKADLAAQLDRARARLARNGDALHADLDMGRHLKEGVKASVSHHKTAILGAATLVGLVLGKLPPRQKKIYLDSKTKREIKTAEKAGIGLMIAQFILNAVKPLLISFFRRKLGEYTAARSGQRPAIR